MLDNSQLSAYHEKQAAQDSRMAILETKVEDLQKGLEDFNNKDKEELNQRLRSIEKQVWGAGAVLAAILAIVGIITQMDMEDDEWDDEAKIEQVVNYESYT